jgi:selenium-dependent xanthine dehydrogenase
MEKMITLQVNGQEYTVPVIPGETLSQLLRERLNLTGTKIGCNEAECGACTVVVDSEAVLSCIYPAERANGKKVTTIEGISTKDEDRLKLHPLQEAFIEHGAVQCGFCIPGQIMTAYALLEKNPNPSSDEIRFALKDTLCRCAGYPAIESSIDAVAKSESYKRPISDNEDSLKTGDQHVVGTRQVRPDAVAKVTGTTIFTDDLKFDGMLFAAVKRAGVPHAILTHLDTTAARELPGVVCVLEAGDIPGSHYHGLVIPDWPSLVAVGEKVRYVGDAVAIVAAESQHIAEAALEKIMAEFEALPVVSDPVFARDPQAPDIHTSGNLLKHIKVRKGDLDQGFSSADQVFEHTFHTPTTEHAFLEPECSIAVPTANGRMEIYVGSQIPYADREQVAKALGWPEERVHVVGQVMGGGFGGKEDISGQIHAALLANATGRPVKLLFDRHESLLVHPKRHATRINIRMGVNQQGKLLAIQSELYGDSGAYASLGEKVMTRATTHSAGPYEAPNIRADCYAMYTNNPPAGAFRGFGVLQSAFAVESMIDMVAEELHIDPVEFRKMNAYRVGSVTNTGQVLRESVGLLECIDLVSKEVTRQAGTEAFLPLGSKDNGNSGGNISTAWGFAAAYKNTGLGGGAPDISNAEVELYPDGTLQVRTSAAELGQGLVTVLQLIVAEEMSVPLDHVRVLVMDTDLTPDGGPTTASRQTYVSGNAARYAARTLKDGILSLVSEKYDVPPQRITFKDGKVLFQETEVMLDEIYQDFKERELEPIAAYEYEAPETKPLGEGGDMHFAFAFAAQAAQVQVNKKTGEVKVLQVVSANDVGKAVNPLGLQGQVEGGIMMGIGHALMENFIVEEGFVISDRLARYRIPSIVHTPTIKSFIVEHPTLEGPYGAKGIGEIVSIPTVPAITNAIYNAVGVRIDRIPVDQEALLWEIRKKNG